jgi:leader peptidase (prepilin peptidase) / N-methyltransferase
MTFSLVTGTAPSLTIVGRWEVTAFAAVVGVIVGSFLNVVVYRVPRHLSVVEPRSFCPHCDTPVRPVDNVPVVSWVLLGGRCHHCREPISMRYPLVELATAALFAALGWGLGPHWAVPGFCVLAATLVALVAVERDGLAPPLSVAAIGTVIGTALLAAAAVADRRWDHLIGLGVGIAVAGTLALVASRHHRPAAPSSWVAALPVLLPVGAGLGWLGPTYGGEGLAATAVVLLLAWGLRRGRSSTAAGAGRGVVGLALAAGLVVATIVAVAAGAGAGY